MCIIFRTNNDKHIFRPLCSFNLSVLLLLMLHFVLQNKDYIENAVCQSKLPAYTRLFSVLMAIPLPAKSNFDLFLDFFFHLLLCSRCFSLSLESSDVG